MKIASIGECMLEVALGSESSNAQFGCGGDTYNCAVYMRREIAAARPPQPATVHYVTALGDDSLSAQLIAQWEAQGLNTQLAFRLPEKLPGLYLIQTASDGERQFHYWREQAAVRDLFSQGRNEVLEAALSEFDLIYFSGITIAILDSLARDALFDLLSTLRAGGKTKIAFDPNYRAQLWSAAQASAALERFVPLVDIALPGLADQHALTPGVDSADTARHWHDLGACEVVVKNGEQPALVSDARDTHWVPVPARVTATDTTAAGDSFNAAYLAARMLGETAQSAATAGHRLASRVVQARGAIVDT